MCYLRLRLNQINRLDRFVTTGHEPGHDNDPDTIFDNYQAEIAVESLTFIRARPQDNRCIVNASGIRTPYGLRTTIQQCKGLICLLSTISHSTASRPVMAARAAMATMAAMATKATMATVSSSMGIRDFGNQMTHRQDMFGTSTGSSMAAVQDEFGSISGLHPRRSSDQHAPRSSGQHRHHLDVFKAIS